jgi:hypothetical protein
MFTELALAAKAAPAYCSNGVLTPAQWKTCWDAGWSQPVTGAANAGAFADHNVAPWALLAGIIIGVLWIVSRAGSGKTATTSN